MALDIECSRPSVGDREGSACSNIDLHRQPFLIGLDERPDDRDGDRERRALTIRTSMAGGSLIRSRRWIRPPLMRHCRRTLEDRSTKPLPAGSALGIWLPVAVRPSLKMRVLPGEKSWIGSGRVRLTMDEIRTFPIQDTDCSSLTMCKNAEAVAGFVHEDSLKGIGSRAESTVLIDA